MNRFLSLLVLAAALFSVSCATQGGISIRKALDAPSSPSPSLFKKGSTLFARVKTTAYCHKEADSLQYGHDSAVGCNLRHDQVRSAAADWSVFPVGTIFKITGMTGIVYRIDDYGSALVGTRTIDIYQPTFAHMNRWGSRVCEIEIVKWGSFSKSLDILDERTKASHVRNMVVNIRRKQQMISVSRSGRSGTIGRQS
jgi:3D (Asp-Asp-Asp) domain-containing protein